MRILTEHQIEQKIQRLAIEILENNYDEPELILAGTNKNGLEFARLLLGRLESISEIPIILTRIQINPADPLERPIEMELTPEHIRDKVVILVDDVANTGRTLFYACKPLLSTLPKKIEAAVLVDRKHKSFPIQVDYVGLSLATTLMNHIEVHIREVEEMEVVLE